MGINHVRDHKGRSRIQLSKRWPDGSRFRRYFSNVTVARKTLSRIEESITMGTWRKLQEELTHGREAEITIAQFAETYLSDYCRAHNTRPDFKEQALVPIVRYLGKVPLKVFRRKHAHQFVAKRSQEVAPATVNRNVAVLKHMLTFALEREYIESHPLVKFRMLPEERKALRVMTLQEERRLVEVVAREEPTIGAYVAVLGETALRKSEGLHLKWSHVDLRQRMLSVEETKSGKPRYIPLTEYAVRWLNSLVRIIDCPWVFACLDTRDRLRDPRGPFERARKVAGLEWVGFHDLRHFRATQWVMRGVDLRTVQELLGHSSITTTMRYAHFAPDHASRAVHRAEQLEVEELRAKSGRKDEEWNETKTW